MSIEKAEKAEIRAIEDVTAVTKDGASDTFVPPDAKEMRRLLWKLDLRIVPYLALLYLCSFLDRSNIGNAKVAGIVKDLNMTESNYNLSLSIFFIGYILFEVPSNLVLKAIGPRLWIPTVMIIWGVILAAMGSVRNTAGLLACRFFLGVAEAGLFPGIIFYLSMWYTRREQATRISMFLGSASLAGAFGGVLAYGIMQMDGLRDLHGWQWIFIIEAIPTLLFALGTYFILPDFPAKSTFITEREREIILHRMKEDAGPATETEFSWKQFRAALLDWKVYMHSIIYICSATPLYSVSMFLPSIIRDIGFEDVQAQAMSAPPYAVACIFTVGMAMSADKRAERGLHIAIPGFVGMIGYMLLVVLKDKGPVALYIASIITVTGVFAHTPTMMSWFSNNIGGHTKRAVASAMIISIGSIGGVLGGQVYRANDAPQYVRANTACACLLAGLVIFSLLFKFILERINKKRDNMSPQEYAKACEGTELCDLHPDFRYIT